MTQPEKGKGSLSQLQINGDGETSIRETGCLDPAQHTYLDSTTYF